MWLDDLAAKKENIEIPVGIWMVDPIRISHNCTITGAGIDRSIVMLKKSGHLIEATNCALAFSGVALHGNKLSASQDVWAVIEATNCTLSLENIFIRDGEEFGLDARGSMVTLKDCITAYCGDRGHIGAALYFREGCKDVSITNCADFGSGLASGSEGASFQTEDCILSVNGYASYGAKKYGLKLQSPNATLNNIKVVSNGAGAAISLQNNNFDLDDIRISDGVGSGIEVSRFDINTPTRNIRIKNVSIERQDWNGIYVVNQKDAIDPMTGITFENVLANRCQYGIRVRGKIDAISVSGACLMDNQRGFWSQSDAIGNPTNINISNANAFGFDTTPQDGFTVMDGSGILKSCNAWNNRVDYNGSAYIRQAIIK